MPIKLWSDEAQDFVDANDPDAGLQADIDRMRALWREATPEQRVKLKALAEAMLARQNGEKPH